MSRPLTAPSKLSMPAAPSVAEGQLCPGFSHRRTVRDPSVGRHPLSLALAVGISALWLVVLAGCAPKAELGPAQTAQAFAQAASRGDVDRAYELLDERTKKRLGKEGVRRLIQGNSKEFVSLRKDLTKTGTRVVTRATLRLRDGERVGLRWQQGGYRLESTEIIDDGATTAVDALAKLRVALLRRSYVALLPLLSDEVRAQVEGEIRALVDALEDPQGLDIRIVGNAAEVELSSGHVIRLERKEDRWRIESVR